MKTLLLILLSTLIYTTVHANEVQNVETDQLTNNSMRLRFISKRPYVNPDVKNKSTQAKETTVDKKEAAKRLNRQFVSKRPHINH
jgi:hypothetical protein